MKTISMDAQKGNKQTIKEAIVKRKTEIKDGEFRNKHQMGTRDDIFVLRGQINSLKSSTGPAHAPMKSLEETVVPTPRLSR